MPGGFRYGVLVSISRKRKDDMKNVPRKALFCKAILLAWDLAGVVLEMLEELEKLKDETPSEARSKVIDAQLLIAKALKLLDEAHKDVWA